MVRPYWHDLPPDGRRATAHVLRLLSRLALYRRLVLFERRLAWPLDGPPLPAGMDARSLAETDLAAYHRFRPDQDGGEIARRLRAGHVCFATWQAGEIVSASWLAVGAYRIDYLGSTLPLASDEACVYDLFTPPGRRQQGATGPRAMALMRWARGAGYRRLLAAVLPEGPAGFALQRRTAYRPIGLVGSVGLGRWRRHFCSVRTGERPPGAADDPPPSRGSAARPPWRVALAPLFRGLAKARVYRRLMLLERRLDEPIVELPLPDGIVVRRIEREHLDAYQAFRSGPDGAEGARRLDEGQWGFAAWYDGRIVGAGWTSSGRASIPYLDWELALAADEAYSHDVFTAPEFRGRGLAPAARIDLLRYARERGCRRILSALLPENTSGWRMPALIGFRPIGWIGYVGAGRRRRRFCHVEPGAEPPGGARG
jgi:GNAT superfamily N-acetyltransferase